MFRLAVRPPTNTVLARGIHLVLFPATKSTQTREFIMSSAASRYRKASHAGSWYTNDGKQLDTQLGDWLTKAGKQQQKGARAIIAPHAGFSYSGPTAAYAYKEIDPTNIRRVFILGPSHHVYLKGCALSRTTYYQTPLYDLTVDAEMNDELHSTGHFEWMSIQTDEDEHSIEMHLPYIAKIMQSQRDAFTVVPVLVGSLNRDRELMYGDLFSKYLNDSSNLFVISSDFCHWGKRFSYSFYEESHGTISQHIEHLDRMGMNLIEKLDSEAFHNYLKQYKNTICGRHPISVLLCAVEAMRRKFSNGHVFEMKFSHYAQSNAATSRSDSSVSYAAGSLTITD